MDYIGENSNGNPLPVGGQTTDPDRLFPALQVHADGGKTPAIPIPEGQGYAERVAGKRSNRKGKKRGKVPHFSYRLREPACRAVKVLESGPWDKDVTPDRAREMVSRGEAIVIVKRQMVASNLHRTSWHLARKIRDDQVCMNMQAGTIALEWRESTVNANLLKRDKGPLKGETCPSGVNTGG